MKNDTFISLNITDSENKLLVKNFPIIFYWNGENDVIDEMKNNDSFYNIVEPFFNIDTYDSVNIYIAGVDKDTYSEKEIKLQEIYKLDEIDLEKYGFHDLLKEIFYQTYKKVCNNDYEIPIDGLSFENILADIYDEIQRKLNRKISKDTFINYILSVLDEKTKLTYTNKKILIDLIHNYLKES